MNSFTQQLRQAIMEVRAYQRSAKEASVIGDRWFDGIIRQMEAASMAPDGAQAALRLTGLSRSIMDSGPLTRGFAPSLYAVFDAVSRHPSHLPARRSTPTHLA